MNKGHLIVLLTALVSGVSIFINAFSVAKFTNPFVFTTFKNTVVAVGLIASIFLLGQRKYLKNLRVSDWKRLVLIGLTGGSIPFLLFFWGLQNSTAATSAFIHKTMVVWVSILAMVFLGERLTRKQAIGAGALFIGLFIASGMPVISFGLGEVAILAATLLWSIETILSKKVLSEIKPVVVAASRMGFGLLVLFPFLFVTNSLGEIALLTPAHYLWIAVTSLFLLGYVWTWYHGLARVQATEATAILLIGAAITTILQWTFLGKEIQLLSAVGITIMLAGLVAVVPSKVLEVNRNVRGVPSQSIIKE